MLSLRSFLPVMALPCGLAMLTGNAQSAPAPVAAQVSEKETVQDKKKKKIQTQTDALPGSVEQLLVRGHRLTAATDGTGDYTVSAVSTTKMLMRPQDVPQSISVISSQQMKDQNLNTVDQALRQVAGVNVNLYGDGTGGYTTRGFALQPQYDGVPSMNGLSLAQQFDLAIYDRIEVLRGPDGILQGSSAPGGSVNFVHKRPTESFSGNASFSGGSWNNYHASVDVGGPVASSKMVSARLVMAGTDRDFFYNTAHDRRWTIYGVTDIRPTRHDTITLSVTSQSNDTGRSMGIPRGTDGADLHLPVSSWYGASWNKDHAPMTEVSGQWEHLFGHGWRFLVNGRHRSTENVLQYAYLRAWDGAAQKGDLIVANTRYAEVNDGVDGYVSGPVHLFGHNHVLMLGANYDHYLYDGGGSSVSSTTNAALHGLTASEISAVSSSWLPAVRSRSWEPTTQWGVYAQAKIQPVDSVSILLGGRVSGYLSQTRTLAPSRGALQTSIDQSGILTPYIGAVWHALPQIAFYVSYTTTFSPQSAWSIDGKQLAPIRGNQIEGGMKGDFFHHRLGLTLAGYKIIQRHEGIYDSTHDSVCGRSGNDDCYVATGKTRSQGAEAELIGRIAKGWDINASYTYNDNRIVNDGDATDSGLVYAPNAPRHLWKLWTHYRFEASERAEKNVWSIGGGLNAQSSTFGNSRLVTQPGYIIASVQAGYQWNRHLSLSMTLNNIGNKRYFQRLGNARFYNYYGEPRNFMFTLRSDF